MSQILVASIGSYPRTGEEKDQQRFPRALGHFERKEISAHALRDVAQSVTQEVIREQIEAGVDEVTDGLLSWSDPISRFTRHLTGVQPGPLSRFFDTNFYYRAPLITAKPKIQPASAADHKFARESSHKTVRAVLTGPLTLAHHTAGEVKPYDRVNARVELFGDVVAQEVAALAAEGAAVIQIDEPSFAQRPEDLPLARAAWERIASAKGSAQLVIALYFHPLAMIVDALKDLPFDVWQLDATMDGPALVNKLASLAAVKAVGLGVVDARNTRMEPVESIGAAVKPIIDNMTAKKIYLTPSWGLESLPRLNAGAKLRRLVEARQLLQAAAGVTRG